MRYPGLLAACLALAPSLAFAFSNPSGTLQGCLDLDCPTSEGENAAVCDMGVRIADATIVQDILPVPDSDTKLSVALTRSPGYIRNTTGLLRLGYDYTFWTIQPEGFSLTTGDEDSDDNLPHVCGFFFEYIWATFPLTGDYMLTDNDGIVNDTFATTGAHDSTECPASGLSDTCMLSIEGLISDIDVKNSSAPCEAIAVELDDRVRYNAHCGGTMEFPEGISVTGTTLLGRGAPASDEESRIQSGDDGFCFPKQKESDRFLLTQKIKVADVAPEDDDGHDVVPDVPTANAGGYLPLMTAQLDKDGKVVGDVSFICLRTLDQPYWAENSAGSLNHEPFWKLTVGLGSIVIVNGFI